MFWIAQKLLYTTRTRSGPARASRRRPAAGKSAPGGTFGTRTGGGVCRVSWGFPHCLRLLRATTGIDTRRIQPLYGHVIAASRCTSGGARGPVIQARAPLGISTSSPNDVSRRRAQLQHACWSRPCYGDSRTLHSGRLADSARALGTASTGRVSRTHRPRRARGKRLGYRLSYGWELLAGGARLVSQSVISRLG